MAQGVRPEHAFTIAAITLIVLKLTGVITWSWWWVLSPIWIADEPGIQKDVFYHVARAEPFQSEIRKFLGKLKSAGILKLMAALCLTL